MHARIVSLVLASSLSAQGWVDVTPPVPGPTASHLGTSTMCFDPVRGVTWLFTQAQIHSWNGTAWTPHLVYQPFASGTTQAVWDPVAERVILASGPNWDFHAWDGTSVTSLGSPPGVSSVSWPCVGFDEANNTVVFIYRNSQFGSTYLATFDGTAWSTPVPSVLPTTGGILGSVPAPEASMYFDSTRNRLTLFCTVPFGNQFMPQCWEWTGSNWVQRYPANILGDYGQVASAEARGLSASVRFGSLGAPRMFTFANSQIAELFLTDWPAQRRDHHIVYDSLRDRFVLHGGASLSSSTPFHDTWELDLGPNAAYTTYGAGCPGSTGTPTLSAQFGSLPSVNSSFHVQVNGLPWTGPCFMWLGFSNQHYAGIPLPVNLAILGAPQCNVLISPDLLFGIPNVLGTSYWSLAIPNLPGWTFYNQAVAFDPQANALGLVFSNAGTGIVGQ